jgi:hypothetical protein
MRWPPPNLELPSLRRLVTHALPDDDWTPSLLARPFGATLSSLVILGGARSQSRDWLRVLDRHAGSALVEVRLVSWWPAVFDANFFAAGDHTRLERNEHGRWSAYEVSGAQGR